MILSEYAKFLQEYDEDLITHKVSPLELLHKWLFQIMNENPQNNVKKIIHKEILYCQNETGDYVIIGKSDSGRKLVTALINFAKSYKNYNHAKRVEMLERKYYS